MQSSLFYIFLVISSLLLILSILSVVFSYFKNAQFKYALFRILNIVLLSQLLISGFLMANIPPLLVKYENSWVLVTMQILCNLSCYISVKRRKTPIRSSFDYIPMD